MKAIITVLFILALSNNVYAQDNIILRTSLGIDAYDISYDDMYYVGGKLCAEVEIFKKFSTGISMGLNVASPASYVSHFGLDMRYYFGKKSMSGVYSELGFSYNPFRFTNVPAGLESLPNKTMSVYMNIGAQRIIKEHIAVGFKVGGGIFNPYYGNGTPPIRLQGAFEIGYKF